MKRGGYAIFKGSDSMSSDALLFFRSFITLDGHDNVRRYAGVSSIYAGILSLVRLELKCVLLSDQDIFYGLISILGDCYNFSLFSTFQHSLCGFTSLIWFPICRRIFFFDI